MRRRDAADLLDQALAADDAAPDAVGGRRLLALVAELEADGVDPDQALRGVLRGLAAAAAAPGAADDA